MKEYILTRTEKSAKGTLGYLSDSDGKRICFTCEDPDNGNQVGISCIPAGTYLCLAFNGTKYKNVWEVTGVPGRSAILIHNGNTIDDTRGCILVGEAIAAFPNGKRGVTNSVATLNKLRGILPNSFELTIINPKEG